MLDHIIPHPPAMEVAVLCEDLLNKAPVEHGGHNVVQYPGHLLLFDLLGLQPLVQNMQHLPTKVHKQDWQCPLGHPAPDPVPPPFASVFFSFPASDFSSYLSIGPIYHYCWSFSSGFLFEN